MTTRLKNTEPTILLADNGSTRVDAAVQLKKIASNLSNKTGHFVHPVSMQHSDKIPVDDINQKLSGIAPQVFRQFMTNQLSKGQREFILIPLFFGKSRAITSFVPNEIELLENEFGSFNLTITDVLYPLPKGEPLLVNILYDNAIQAANGNSQEALRNLVLVDHGSPIPTVTAVREHIASALNDKLPNGIKLQQAAMERRKGKKYDFNGTLLENYLSDIAKAGETQATVLLLFLLPGSHAGNNGDIVQICNRIMDQNKHFNVSISALIGQNDKLIDCLSERLKQVL